MYLSPRPSKIVFQNLLCRAIADSEPFNTVLDCASAGAKFRALFKGKEYHGVDINNALIEKAVENYQGDSLSYFYHDDMFHFKSPVRNRQFDLVVSTHTIAHVGQERAETALSNLIDRVRPGGYLILQCPVEYLQISQKVGSCRFQKGKVFLYRGFLSQAYEAILSKIFQTDAVGGLWQHGNTALYDKFKYIVLGLSLTISKIDYFGQNESAIMFFKGKI